MARKIWGLAIGVQFCFALACAGPKPVVVDVDDLVVSEKPQLRSAMQPSLKQANTAKNLQSKKNHTAQNSVDAHSADAFNVNEADTDNEADADKADTPSKPTPKVYKPSTDKLTRIPKYYSHRVWLSDGVELTYIIETQQENPIFHDYAEQNAEAIFELVDRLMVQDLDAVSVASKYWFKKISNKAKILVKQNFEQETGQQLEFLFFAIQKHQTKSYLPTIEGIPIVK